MEVGIDQGRWSRTSEDLLHHVRLLLVHLHQCHLLLSIQHGGRLVLTHRGHRHAAHPSHVHAVVHTSVAHVHAGQVGVAEASAVRHCCHPTADRGISGAFGRLT